MIKQVISKNYFAFSITNNLTIKQYEPYYWPIWAILPNNMGHITGPPPTPPQGRGAVRLSHKAYKAYKTYKSYMTYKSYKTYKPSPLRGTEGGLPI